MAAPTSRRGWPSGTVCLQVWNDSYNGMVLCRRDCKNACSLCPVSARHAYLGCRRTGCGLCWVAGLFCLIQRSVSLICSGWTPTNRPVASVSVCAKQTLRRAEPFFGGARRRTPFRHRSSTVHPPFIHRSSTVHPPFKLTPLTVPH